MCQVRPPGFAIAVKTNDLKKKQKGNGALFEKAAIPFLDFTEVLRAGDVWSDKVITFRIITLTRPTFDAGILRAHIPPNTCFPTPA